ncbi:MAG: hypothetical protein MUC60_05365 [Oscillatoria sp. Prado101]|jgi:hypothetical protein|nr:hypothetical protein [Oscillatoria sp. Prado101]
MSVECFTTKTLDDQSRATTLLEEPEKDPLISPQASTCTWCGKNMIFGDHCKSRNQAANCYNYAETRKRKR